MITPNRRRKLTKADSVLALIDRETEKTEHAEEGKIQEVSKNEQPHQQQRTWYGKAKRKLEVTSQKSSLPVRNDGENASNDDSSQKHSMDDSDDLDLDRSSSRPNLLLEFAIESDDAAETPQTPPGASHPTQTATGIDRVSSEDDLLDFKSNHSHICSMSIDEEDADDFSFSSYNSNEDDDHERSNDTTIIEDEDQIIIIDSDEQQQEQEQEEPVVIQQSPQEERQNDHTDNQRRVSFGKCVVYLHPMIAGDAIPQVGLPVTLDWECQHHYEYDMNNVDSGNSPVKSKKEQKLSIYLTSQYRRAMLKEAGYSNRELRLLGKRTIEARTRRQRTLNTMSFEPLHRFMEKMGRLVCKPMNAQEAARSQEILQFLSDKNGGLAGAGEQSSYMNRKKRNTQIYEELSLEMKQQHQGNGGDTSADGTPTTAASSSNSSDEDETSLLQITVVGSLEDTITSTELSMQDAKSVCRPVVSQ